MSLSLFINNVTLLVDNCYSPCNNVFPNRLFRSRTQCVSLRQTTLFEFPFFFQISILFKFLVKSIKGYPSSWKLVKAYAVAVHSRLPQCDLIYGRASIVIHPFCESTHYVKLLVCPHNFPISYSLPMFPRLVQAIQCVWRTYSKQRCQLPIHRIISITHCYST